MKLFPRRRHEDTLRLPTTDREPTCAEVGRVLQAFLDGHVDPASAARLEEHLEHCRRCGLDLAAYTAIKASLASHGAALDRDVVARLVRFGEQLVAAGPPPTADTAP